MVNQGIWRHNVILSQGSSWEFFLFGYFQWIYIWYCDKNCYFTGELHITLCSERKNLNSLVKLSNLLSFFFLLLNYWLQDPNGKKRDAYFSFWLGVSDLDVHSVYRTVEGYIPPWSNWGSGEPSFRSKVGDLNCVRRLEASNDRKWYDTKCSWSTWFYCESSKYELFCIYLILRESNIFTLFVCPPGRAGEWRWVALGSRSPLEGREGGVLNMSPTPLLPYQIQEDSLCRGWTPLAVMQEDFLVSLNLPKFKQFH